MPWRLVEIPIAVQLIICAIVQSRILAWVYAQGMRRTFWFSTVMFAALPIIVGIQFLIAFLHYDVSNTPQVPLLTDWLTD